MADVVAKVAPPTLYYAQADGTEFKDSQWFGYELETKAGFRNLLSDFVPADPTTTGLLKAGNAPDLPIWRVNASSQADAKGIAVMAPGGLNGSNFSEFGNDRKRADKAAEEFEKFFVTPAVSVDAAGAVSLGAVPGAKAIHRAHLLAVSSHGWLGGYCMGNLGQRKWWVVGDLAQRGLGFRGPLWIILAQCSTLNSATWASWATMLAKSDPHVRGILGYEEVAPGANVAAVIGKGFVASLKAGKTFLEAWKERNSAANWAAIVHKDAVNDKLKDLPKLVASNAKFASVDTTSTSFSYYGYLKNDKKGAAQEIYIKSPPFALAVKSTGTGFTGPITPATLAQPAAYLINRDKYVVSYEVTVTADAADPEIEKATFEWIHIRPTKVRLDMTQVFDDPVSSPSATVKQALVKGKKAAFELTLSTASRSVKAIFATKDKAGMSSVATNDVNYHGDDKLVPHHSYIYLRVTLKLVGGATKTHDFPTQGMSWLGFIL